MALSNIDLIQVVQYGLGLSLAYWVTIIFYNQFCQGINHIPGPSLWATTDLFRVWDAWGRRPDITLTALHAKYGKLVRIGPNTVSISDPTAIKVVYGIKNPFRKSDFFSVFRAIARGRELHSMVNITDDKFHARLRRSVSNAFAMSSLVLFEPLVDSTSTAFFKQIDQRFADRPDGAGVCDFGLWLQFYAFDVIGELTFSKRLGFLDSGVDVFNLISMIEKAMAYTSLKNPIRMWCSRVGLISSTSPFATFAREQMANKHKESGVAKYQDGPARKDFLDRFYEAHDKDPEFMNAERVLALTVGNVMGGSDTTAITLRAIFYFLLKNPAKLQKLMDEIEQMTRDGKFAGDNHLLQWSEVRNWPYLTAVIKEAMRCHPATGVPLERIVPAGGATICGTFIPEGTIVGCSGWLTQMHKPTYGEDVEVFRPERWLEGTEAEKTAMNNALLTFGAGTRSCIGKNITYLEVYKLVPALLKRYEISLADPDAEWTLWNAWLVKQSNFFVRFKTRNLEREI